MFCDNNQLTELNVSHNERLYSLTCSNNSLKSINLSKNIGLWELDCSNNKLSNIDITNNPDLAILKCHENFLDTETLANTILGLDAVLEEIGEPLSKDDPDNWFAYYPQKIAEPSPIPTAEPSPTLTAEPGEKQCVKIIAEYDDNGALKNIKTETINISDAVRTDNSRNIKTFYWESLDSMKPICEQ